MAVSLDGYVSDRHGAIDWTGPSEDLFADQLAHVGGLGAYLLGRRLHETMRVWETEPALRDTEAGDLFADVWTALPKVVFSRTLEGVEGNARLATGSVAEEIAGVLASTGRDVAIGGPQLAAQAIALDLVDEFRVVRGPAMLGGGEPYLPRLPDVRPLELVEARPYSNGAVLERFRRLREPARLVST